MTVDHYVFIGTVVIVGVFLFAGWLAFLEKQGYLAERMCFFERFEVSPMEVDAILRLYTQELITASEARMYLGIGEDGD